MEACAGTRRGDAGEEEAAGKGGQQEEGSEAAHRVFACSGGGRVDLCVGGWGRGEWEEEGDEWLLVSAFAYCRGVACCWCNWCCLLLVQRLRLFDKGIKA